jgi:hypothetical protein
MGTIKSMNLRYQIPQTPTAAATIPPRTQTQPIAIAIITTRMQIPITPQTPIAFTP